jgi:hypothetical protein
MPLATCDHCGRFYIVSQGETSLPACPVCDRPLRPATKEELRIYRKARQGPLSPPDDDEPNVTQSRARDSGGQRYPAVRQCRSAS